MLHLTLYKYANKPIIVDKSNYLGTGLAVTGDAMTSNQDMENPVVLLSFTTEPDYNYAYIQEYHRYYYLTQKTWVSANVWSMTFHVDEIYTYKALVSSLSGIVAYSNSGSGLKYDARLAYNKAPTRIREAAASTIKAPSQFYVLMPTIFFNSGTGYTPKNNMRYYLFPLSTFKTFMLAYSTEMGNDSALCKAAGALIQQISLVTWLDPNDFTNYEYNATGTIRFDSPEINEIQAGGSAGGWEFEFDNSQTPGGYYIAYDDTVHRGLNLSWRVTNSAYWTRKAIRTIYIPFVGKVSVGLDDLGIGETSDFYLGVNISYDYSSNAYVVTPGTALPATGSNNFDHVYETQAIRVPNMYGSPFVVDVSHQYFDETMTRQVNGLLNQFVGNTMQTAMTSGAMLPQLISNTMTNIADLGITSSMLQYQEAASLVVQGSNNGGSPDSAYILQEVDAGGNIVKIYPSAIMETLVLYPSDNYSDFWTDHGLPDGAHRSLSGMTGYVQMKEFEMIYNANATIGEMARLEAQLYRGVIL